jgi:phosphohistidine phosphatase
VTDDGSRELTRDGITKMRRVVRGLASLKIQFDHIWTSPYVRARQTADIVLAQFPQSGSVRKVRALEPGGDFNQIFSLLAENASLENVALVGHEPDLSELAGQMLTGTRSSIIELKKGGVACMEIEQFREPYNARLLWLLTPGQLRALA